MRTGVPGTAAGLHTHSKPRVPCHSPPASCPRLDQQISRTNWPGGAYDVSQTASGLRARVVAAWERRPAWAAGAAAEANQRSRDRIRSRLLPKATLLAGE